MPAANRKAIQEIVLELLKGAPEPRISVEEINKLVRAAPELNQESSVSFKECRTAELDAAFKRLDEKMFEYQRAPKQ